MLQTSETFESLASSIHAILSPLVTDQTRLALLTAIVANGKRQATVKEVEGLRRGSVYQATLRLRDRGYIAQESMLSIRVGYYTIPQDQRLRILSAIRFCLELMGVSELKWLGPEDARMDEADIVRTLHCIFASDSCLIVYLWRCRNCRVRLNSSLKWRYTRRLINHGFLEEDKTVNRARHAECTLALRSLAFLLDL